jgi:dGTPase
LNGAEYADEFKTIECSIMDIADDIAYSTYDLEDSFKRLSARIARDGYERVKATSDLVQQFMEGVEVVPNSDIPSMSKAKLNLETFKKVEVLKNITYEAIIMSPRMRVVEYRGYDVIKSIFDAISTKNGHMLLPDDYRELYQAASGAQKKRIICDFIAGMTDRYAWQFYGRICGSDPMTIHLPV